jgi:nucleotide-binding universal stress UspA family protein
MEEMRRGEIKPLSVHLAVDGSEHSLAAARLIRELPLPPGSEVVVLSVLTPRYSPGRSVLMAASDQVRELLEDSGYAIKHGLLHGHPAEELTNFAYREPPDLISVGAKGLNATLGILLGGVAQQLVEYSRWPVLVTRAPYTGLRRILLVTDGSMYSRVAVDYLAHFPLPAESEVVVMHVLLPAASLQTNIPGELAGRVRMPDVAGAEIEEAAARQAETEERDGQAILAEATQTLQAAGVKASSLLARGDATGEILEFARQNDTDLIVAGSRGLSRVKGWLMGSVSRKLVYHAGCSVLIVKPNHETAGAVE